MFSLRRDALFAYVVLLIALTPGFARAQAHSKRPSTSSKTELRPQTIHLHLAQYQTFSAMKWKRKDIGDQTAGAFIPANSLFTGYLHDTNGNVGGVAYESRNEFYRGALRFHSTKLLHHQIIKATLNLRVYKTHLRGVHSANDRYTQTTSCARSVQSGKATWWTDPQAMIDLGPPTAQAGQSGTSDLHIDVTDIVKQWSEPHSNFGLVLVGENEDLRAYTETICQTQFVHAGQGAPTLTVVYR